MVRRTSIVIPTATVTGVLLGCVAGYFWPEMMTSVDFLGQLFVNALRLILIPLIVASIIVGVSGLGDVRKTGRTTASTVIYFAATTTVAVCVGIILVNVIGPGFGVDNSLGFVPDQIHKAKQVTTGTLISNLIPVNPIGAMLASRYLGIILFSLLFGAVLTTMGNRKRAVVEFFRAVQEAIVKLINLILYAAPIGLFFLVGSAVAQNVNNVSEVFQGILPYILVLAAGFLIHGLIILPLILKFLAHRSPLEYFGKLIPAVTTAFGTGSTSVTLPVTYDCVVKKNGIDSRVGSMVLPLGTTMNLDATSMYVAVVALFVGQTMGLDISSLQVVLIGLVAILASFGAAGIPGASLFMLVMVFEAAGFPEQAYAGLGLVVIADWFVDRCRAAVNVWGDAVGAAVIAQRLKNITRTKPRSEKSSHRSTRPTAKPTRREGDYHRGSRQTGTPYGNRESRGGRRGDDRQRSREPEKVRNNRNYNSKFNRRDDAKSKPAKPSPFEINPEQTPVIDFEKPKSSSSTSENRNRNGRKTTTSPAEAKTERKPSLRQETRKPPPATTSDTVRKSKPVHNSNRETEREPAPRPIRMTESTIERERSRLETQLTEMRKKEELRKSASKPSDSSSIVDQPIPFSGKSATDTEEKPFPRIDYNSDSATPKSSPGSHSVVRDTSNDSEQSVNRNTSDASRKPESKPATTEYGRARNRRGEKPHNQPAASGDATSRPSTKASSNDEEPMFEVQSFGRGKKKRTRR